ncbi:MAG: ATP-hydrolyzing 5-oxoprolinase [Leptolyngbyaceae cyanobacterium CSU_1_3]|nr:ATP-hydrolyzing 5-oxoprolinase [Leptolyngbyaceae cyanobacterium CSU_1_3]
MSLDLSRDDSIVTPPNEGRWQLWIDRGGTFTDIVAQRDGGEIIVHKLLSQNPERYADAAIQGIREILGLPVGSPIPSAQIAAVKMGTTVATNALLERKGDRTLLLITQGFRDALRIGYQNRPHIFARQIVLPEMLYERVIEVEERYTVEGEERTSVQIDAALVTSLQTAYADGIRSCAIVFLHSYRYPDHERQVAAIVGAIDFTQVSVSHQVSPLIKLVGRGDTTVVDAYLSPILRRYVEQVAAELGAETKLLFMQSHGGLTDARLFQGKDSLLSGPAGGIVGAAKTSAMAGFNKIIGFDMGGTSTDASHFSGGEYERSFETEVAGVRLRSPMMSIHTVAAGGGSLLSFDGSRYRVGPESAGADPGPACYRRGGALTVTDCNVMVGKVQANFFPKVFGADGTLPLDAEIVRQKFAELAQEIAQNSLNLLAPEVLLEIFNHLFRAIAEEMGVTLQNTSLSVNIKERLDFSCALFDQQGQLVANAPHIPVHLGSMSESVLSLIEAQGDTLKPGDVYLSNNPYNGGTHLPDITVITPVFLANAAPLFYLASRGHHADIGGITPGSMPPHSTTIAQEEILLDNRQLVDRGQFREAELLEWLTAGEYPARNPAQNVADLQAQIAANERGAAALKQMVAHYGLETVQAYMQHVQENAEASVRRAIGVLSDGRFIYPTDEGSQIQVSIQINAHDRSAHIDFTGTSPQTLSNFNAPLAVCKAAVLYVFRSLVDDDIPLNAGCLKPLEITVLEGCLLNPHFPAAVVAGNVETSQAIVNALYGALGILAASQGTMNNFTFGNDRYQYYETICGGSGAGADFDGADAIQTHMTNSRLTDPEVLELRFPVLVESFAIRGDSGGQGRHKGGNGVIRQIRFRSAMTAAILSGHRVVPPFGLQGGAAGAIGRNWVQRSTGEIELLGSRAEVTMQPNDLFVIETPGGGGFGQYPYVNDTRDF